MNAVHFVEEAGCTNDDARDLAARGAPDGTAVIARVQTAGRGRLGRSWWSPAGASVALSYVHRSTLAPDQLSGLTLDAAVAVATVIEDITGVQVSLKWPNDLLVEGRKVGGVLTELHTDLDASGRVVVIVGVGLNVNGSVDAMPEELRELSTTLEAVSRRSHDVELLGHGIVRRLAEKLHGFERYHGPDLAAYLPRFPFRGARVEVGAGEGARRGTIEDVSADGGLRVRFDGEAAGEAVIGGLVELVRS